MTGIRARPRLLVASVTATALACGGRFASSVDVSDDAEAPPEASAVDHLVHDATTDPPVDVLEASPPSDAALADDGICNDVANGAPTIGMSDVVGQPPSPQGGQVVPGIYYLTHVNRYLASADAGYPADERWTLSVSAAPLHIESVFDDLQSLHVWRQSIDVSTNGTSMTWTSSCPSAGTTVWGYTATATQLRLYYYQGYWESVYELQ